MGSGLDGQMVVKLLNCAGARFGEDIRVHYIGEKSLSHLITTMTDTMNPVQCKTLTTRI